jgi:hypothetical protein
MGIIARGRRLHRRTDGDEIILHVDDDHCRLVRVDGLNGIGHGVAPGNYEG